jgi:hypothetical protein
MRASGGPLVSPVLGSLPKKKEKEGVIFYLRNDGVFFPFCLIRARHRIYIDL